MNLKGVVNVFFVNNVRAAPDSLMTRLANN